MKLLLLLIVAILAIVLIVAVVYLAIDARRLRRRIAGLDEPELWLPRSERGCGVHDGRVPVTGEPTVQTDPAAAVFSPDAPAAGSPDLCYPTNPLYAEIVDQYEAEQKFQK